MSKREKSSQGSDKRFEEASPLLPDNFTSRDAAAASGNSPKHASNDNSKSNRSVATDFFAGTSPRNRGNSHLTDPFNDTQTRSSVRDSIMKIPEQLRSFVTKMRALDPEERMELAKACKIIAEDNGYTRRSSFFPQVAGVGGEHGGGGAGLEGTLSASRAVSEKPLLDSAHRFQIEPGSPELPKKRWGVSLLEKQHLYIFRAGLPMYVHLPTAFAQLLVVVCLWIGLWAAFGKAFEPHGAVFDSFFTVFFAGIVGGLSCFMLQLPPLIGIMWAAVLYANLPGNLTSGITTTVTSPFKNLGLTIILLRGGIGLNVKTIRPILRNALMLGVMPMFLEATVTGFVAASVFDYNTNSVAWAYLHGFTTAPLSASVVVSSCLNVQSKGHGSFGGPTILMLSSVGFDSSLGIWGSTFLQSLVFTEHDPLITGLLAPLQIFGGAALGILAGTAISKVMNIFFEAHDHANDGREEFERSANVRSFFLVLLFAVGVIFLSKKYEFEGGGALCVVCFGATINYHWVTMIAKDPTLAARKRHFCENIATLWDIVGMPAVFAFVGAAMNLGSVFDGDFLKHAFIVFGAGCVARGTAALVSTWSTDFSFRERVVLCLGWCGKATAQATLGSMVLDRAQTLLSNAKTPEDIDKYTEWVRRGQIIANMSVIAIMLGAPVSSMVIRKLGVRWIRVDQNVFEEKDAQIQSQRNFHEQKL